MESEEQYIKRMQVFNKPPFRGGVKNLLDWIESHMGLHRTVEFLYVVDGYRVSLVDDDGATVVATGEGETLMAAVLALKKGLNE